MTSNKIGFKETVERLVAEQGWTREFATEYAMERLYHGRTHQEAFQVALRSPWVPYGKRPH